MKYINAKTEEAIRARIGADIENGMYLGAAAAVYQDGRLISVLLGEENMTSHTPVGEHMLFRIASMSKPITGVAVLTLVERGFLSLDEEIRTYFPWLDGMKIAKPAPDGTYTKTGTSKNHITVRMLLNHSSGVLSGDLRPQYHAIPQEKRMTLKDAVACYGDTYLEFEPGTAHSYSSVGAFDVLCRLCEIASGTDYETYLQTAVFAPLGMTDTTFVLTPERRAHLVDMNTRTADSKPFVAPNSQPAHIFEDIPAQCYSGGAGLVSSLHDYLRFAKMLLCGGVHEGRAFLQPETFAKFFEPASLIGDWDYTWIFGLSMRYVVGPNRLPIGSFGWSGAYGSHFFVDPENRLCAIYLKNSYTGGGANAKEAADFETDVETTLSDTLQGDL